MSQNNTACTPLMSRRKKKQYRGHSTKRQSPMGHTVEFKHLVFNGCSKPAWVHYLDLRERTVGF